MRHIGKLPDEQLARRFEDYMLVEEVRVRVEPEDGQWAVWVVEEDQLDRAKQELAQFNADPAAERYRGHGQTAHRTRKEEDRANRRFRKNQINLRTAWKRSGGIPKAGPVTIALIAISVACTLVTNFGEDRNSFFYFFTFFDPDKLGRGNEWLGWEGLLSGELWRAVTPMFLHFHPLHLLFNMLMFHVFASQMERRLKSGLFLVFVLAVAAISNIAEYVWIHWKSPDTIIPVGGMSGVVYGLFGYIWMKHRYEPQQAYLLGPNTVLVLLGWMVLCMLGIFGNVANGAHLLGLVSGCAIGYWNTFLRTYFR